MDWFEKLTGFAERDYAHTRAQLEVIDGKLHSLVNDKSYGVGQLELVSLNTLRQRVDAGPGLPGQLKVSIVRGDVRAMHGAPENAGAMFQVASQFNLLEMTSPEVTPEHGVTRYQYDGTQGPACAIAAGAATIYRNYFAKIDGQVGQTRDRQFDGLADIGLALCSELELPLEALWTMRNGYALCTQAGLDEIAGYLESVSQERLSEIGGLLRIGLHHDVEVTDGPGTYRPQVTQAFCSALPVRYTDIPGKYWKPFASLILQAAYEATMLAAMLNAKRGESKVVLLTRLGGGVFGNDDDWIHKAIERALNLMEGVDLDVRLVSYGKPSSEIQAIANRFG